MKTLSPLISSGETALDRKKQEWYLKGYDEGMIAGELKGMARIKASIDKYIDEQQKLYDTTDSEQGYNFDNCDGLEAIINKIIIGEK